MKLFIASFGLLAVALSFKTGKQYNFKFEGQLSSGLLVPSSPQNASRVQSHVSLTFVDDQPVLFEITSIRLGSAHLDFVDTDDIQSFNLFKETELTEEQKEKFLLPAQFQYSGGVISELEFNNEDPAYSTNLKKITMNMIQAIVNSDEKKHYKSIESTPEGYCATSYSILSSGSTRNVSKTIDSASCTGRVDVSGYQFGQACFTCNSTPPNTTTGSSRYRFELTGSLSTPVVSESHLSSVHHFVSESGPMRTKIVNSLTLISSLHYDSSAIRKTNGEMMKSALPLQADIIQLLADASCGLDIAIFSLKAINQGLVTLRDHCDELTLEEEIAMKSSLFISSANVFAFTLLKPKEEIAQIEGASDKVYRCGFMLLNKAKDITNDIVQVNFPLCKVTNPEQFESSRKITLKALEIAILAVQMKCSDAKCDPPSHSHSLRCAVSTSRMKTFYESIYRAPLTTCFSVLTKDCSSEEPRFSVLFKKINKNGAEKKMKVITRENVIEMEMNKRDEIEVTVDGKKCNEKKMNEYGLEKSGSVVIFENEDIFVKFDGYKTEVKMNEQYKAKQCGLCGHFDGEKKGEFTYSDVEETEDLQEFHQSILREYEECEKKLDSFESD